MPRVYNNSLNFEDTYWIVKTVTYDIDIEQVY
jgi:hypothetical protein